MKPTLLPRGQITVEGPFYDTRDSVLAITGGTGAYANARGSMELKSRASGTEFAFIFHLIG
jgi:allene oxide cyclase